MPLRVIDNKKIDLTEDEWILYQKIVKSYTNATNKGEDLFKDLFESNDEGIIIFLKPPSTQRTSFEVFLFLISIMNHQHLRVMYKRIDDICQQVKDKLHLLDK